MNICVVGTGYVGLVSGVCLAAKGHSVVCVDVNKAIVEKLNAGVPTIYERGLGELLQSVIQDQRFFATDDLFDAMKNAEAVLIAVGTPSDNSVINLSYIKTACEQIGKFIQTTERHITVIIKSTVTPGTTDTFVRRALENASRKKLGEFGLGMTPEFLREGEAVDDFMYPDRIVLGYETDETLVALEKMFQPWKVDKVRVNSRTAELIKYANNAFLALQISTINEIANFSSILGGIDIMDVVEGIRLDKRWNPIIDGKRANPKVLDYIIPGCGFGGSCFPKDVQAIVSQGRLLGTEMKILSSVLDVNDAQPYRVVKLLENKLTENSPKNVLVLGLAFKAGTDDVRETPAFKIVQDLVRLNLNVMCHDPVAGKNFNDLFAPNGPSFTTVYDWKECMHEVDTVIVLTAWDEYYALEDLDLRNVVLLDARRMFDEKRLNAKRYLSIGKTDTKDSEQLINSYLDQLI